MESANINLLKKTGGSAGFKDLEARLRLISLWSLGILFGIGITVGISYFVIASRAQALNNEKVDLAVQIQAQSVKEGIIISLKQRIVLAGKALSSTTNWAKLFPLLTAIAPAEAYDSLTVDGTGHVAVQFKLGSVDAVVTLVKNVIDLSDNGSLRLSQLTSFSMLADGTVQLGLTFVPML